MRFPAESVLPVMPDACRVYRWWRLPVEQPERFVKVAQWSGFVCKRSRKSIASCIIGTMLVFRNDKVSRRLPLRKQ
jgi:hypothetical protein